MSRTACLEYAACVCSGKLLFMGDASLLNIAECVSQMTDADMNGLAEWLRAFLGLDAVPEGGDVLRRLVEAMGTVFLPCSYRVGFDQRACTAYFFFDVGTYPRGVTSPSSSRCTAY
jgi:hypothetical protein